MKKLVYVVESEANGESLYIGSSYACSGAEAIAKQSAHSSRLTVSAFLIDAENGESAEEAVRRCFGCGLFLFAFPQAISTYSI